MGRHREKSISPGRHHTIIALSALVPGGLIAAATSAHANGSQPVSDSSQGPVDAAAAPPDTISLEKVYTDLKTPAGTAPPSAADLPRI